MSVTCAASAAEAKERAGLPPIRNAQRAVETTHLTLTTYFPSD
jgi:hypothetical protein